MMRTFCLFTMRLPKSRQVQYEWLAQQDLEAEEITEITDGTMRLLAALNPGGDTDEEGEGNAPKPPKGKATKS